MNNSTAYEDQCVVQVNVSMYTGVTRGINFYNDV